MRNLDYRGHRSTTLHVVLLVFATGTGLLLSGHLEAEQWVTGVLGLVSAYVLRDAAAKVAEAYRDRDRGTGS